jgi:hypothetical protein
VTIHAASKRAKRLSSSRWGDRRRSRRSRRARGRPDGTRFGRPAGPLQVGDSAAHYSLSGAGTLGPFVELPADGSVAAPIGVLSCNHVFVPANKPAGPAPCATDHLIRPGQLDGGAHPEHWFGELADFRPLATAAINALDAAVGRVQAALVPANPKSIDGVGTLKGGNSDPGYLAALTIDDDLFRRSKAPKWPIVRKRGRTTGTTSGFVRQAGARWRWVRYAELPGRPELDFADLIVVQRPDGDQPGGRQSGVVPGGAVAPSRVLHSGRQRNSSGVTGTPEVAQVRHTGAGPTSGNAGKSAPSDPGGHPWPNGTGSGIVSTI